MLTPAISLSLDVNYLVLRLLGSYGELGDSLLRDLYQRLSAIQQLPERLDWTGASHTLTHSQLVRTRGLRS
jgi:hypothetical protein